MPKNFLDIDEKALAGMALALKKVDKEAKKEWAKAMRTTGTRVWRSAVSKRQTLAQDRIFGRASVRWTQGGKGTAVVAVKQLSGGYEYPNVIDFGGKQQRQNVDGHTVSAHTRRGVQVSAHRRGPFTRRTTLPRYVPSGRVVAPAMTPLGRFMGQMALKTTADLIREAAD